MAALVAAGALALPATAQATIHERGTWEDAFTETYDDCGFPIELSGQAGGDFRLREGKRHSDQAFLVLDRFAYQELHVNPATGDFFTIRGRGIFNEVTARPYDGTVLEFRVVEAGQLFTVRDAAGDVVLRDRGSITFSYLFDTLGDSMPGGEFVADVGDRVNGLHPSDDLDFCAMAAELIG
ncbi:MAG TPA: hypothetical protein VD836_16755 [Solirubrobacteraceae bacterium]|nr:hypothetical protein [Solirubrobacteraceae bacterium]